MVKPETNIKYGGDLIFEFKNALPDELCDKLVSFFEEHKEYQYKGVIGREALRPHIKKTIDIFLPDHAMLLKEELSQLVYYMHRCFFEYYTKHSGFHSKRIFLKMKRKDVIKSFQKYIGMYIIYDFIMKRYSVEDKGKFDWHNDLSVSPLRTSTRRFGFILYLNDVDKGGETEFLYQSKTIKPEKGKIVIFPPFWTHTHRALSPVSNEKYVISSWLCADFTKHHVDEYEALKRLEEEKDFSLGLSGRHSLVPQHSQEREKEDAKKM